MTKRLDAIRQRLLVLRNAYQTLELGVVIRDFDYLLSMVEKQREALDETYDYFDKFRPDEGSRAWDVFEKVEQALKCEEGGEAQ